MTEPFIHPTEQGYDPETGEQIKNAKVEELWAWVSVDPKDGSEGILAYTAHGYQLPMIGADKTRIESFRPFVQSMLYLSPTPIELRRFSQMEVIERLEP